LAFCGALAANLTRIELRAAGSSVPQKGFPAMHPLLTRSFLAALAALLLALPIACHDDEPERGSRSAGGENALDRAGRKIDTAHQNFKREVRPAAQVVDEKTKEAVGEGKKAVEKTIDAVDDAAD